LLTSNGWDVRGMDPRKSRIFRLLGAFPFWRVQMSPRFQLSEEDHLLDKIYKYIDSAAKTSINHPNSVDEIVLWCCRDVIREVINHNTIRSRPIIFCDEFSNN
jgi:hypothetical protein